jgi:DMSO/TMAO reductase YedYZ molybdopterin-dependent catalytic subunit
MDDRDRRLDVLAGVAAAAVALGAGELIAGLAGVTSLIVAVGNLVVDWTPGPVVKWAIDLLGTADKPVLLATIVSTSLLVGALLAPLAARRPDFGKAAFAVFGLVGLLAASRDPFTGFGPAFWVAVPAALAGWFTLRRLLEAATPEVNPHVGIGGVPGPGVANRRRFLAFAGAATGGAALAVVTGRGPLNSAVDVEAQREALVLPVDALAPAPAAPGLPIEGLSPLITPNDRFYRIDTALVLPRVDVSTWRLRIRGMVDQPYELTFADLQEMASVQQSATLACVSNEVGGRLVGNAVWLGVPLADLLERAGVHPDATQIVGRSVEGFTAGFPTEVALDGRAAMVAIGMNGEPLPVRHGFPARLVVPGLYGYVSATKWLAEIELTRLEDFDGYWIPRGWAKEAPIKTQSRIDVPRAGATLQAGLQPIAGVAWGGARGVDRVEVRVSRLGEAPSEHWLEARLSEELTRSSWRQWVVEWPAEPGDYRIEVRATDGEGETQTSEVRPPAPDGATGWHRRVVSVRAT